MNFALVVSSSTAKDRGTRIAGRDPVWLGNRWHFVAKYSSRYVDCIPVAAAISVTPGAIPELPDLAYHLAGLGARALQIRAGQDWWVTRAGLVPPELASDSRALQGCFEEGKVRLSASTIHLGRACMIIRKGQAAVDRGTEEDEQKYGARESLHLSEEGGLTQFVAHVETLQ